MSERAIRTVFTTFCASQRHPRVKIDHCRRLDGQGKATHAWRRADSSQTASQQHRLNGSQPAASWFACCLAQDADFLAQHSTALATYRYGRCVDDVSVVWTLYGPVIGGAPGLWLGGKGYCRAVAIASSGWCLTALGVVVFLLRGTGTTCSWSEALPGEACFLCSFRAALLFCFYPCILSSFSCHRPLDYMQG